MVRTNKLFKSDLSLCCGNDSSRPAFDYVAIKNGYAYATNAHVMLRQCLSQCLDVEPEVIAYLEGKIIHKNDFKNLLKGVVFDVSETQIIAEDKKGSKYLAELTTEAAAGVKMPNYEAVLNGTQNEVGEIGINTDLLATLRKSMYSPDLKHELHLSFSGLSGGIRVRTFSFPFEAQLGLIMPMVIKH